MVKADYLFLMTDVDCLYTSNPRTDPDAQRIEVVTDISALEADVSSAGSALGTGGMGTKVVAAKLGSSAGVTTIITKSSKPGNVYDIVNYLQSINVGPPVEDPALSLSSPSANGSTDPVETPLHTRFLPSDHPIQSRSFWLLHGLTPRGSVFIDHGAFNALQDNASLFPAGVVGVDGHFAQHEAVRLVAVKKPSPDALDGEYQQHAQDRKEVGRALVNYSSNEIMRIKGHRSTHIESLLGYADSEYIAVRENISILPEDGSGTVTPILDLEGTWKSP